MCPAVLLPSRDAQVPLPPVFATGRDAAHRLGIQHGGAPAAAAEGPHSDGSQAQAKTSQVAERLVAPLTGFGQRGEAALANNRVHILSRSKSALSANLLTLYRERPLCRGRYCLAAWAQHSRCQASRRLSLRTDTKYGRCLRWARATTSRRVSTHQNRNVLRCSAVSI